MCAALRYAALLLFVMSMLCTMVTKRLYATRRHTQVIVNCLFACLFCAGDNDNATGSGCDSCFHSILVAIAAGSFGVGTAGSALSDFMIYSFLLIRIILPVKDMDVNSNSYFLCKLYEMS